MKLQIEFTVFLCVLARDRLSPIVTSLASCAIDPIKSIDIKILRATPVLITVKFVTMGKLQICFDPTADG